MPDVLHISVDDREREAQVTECLASDPAVRITRARLDVGDYQVEGMAVIERKTVTDFARSIVDGRLFRQAARLASHSLPAVMILEGAWQADLTVEGVSRQAWQGALVCLTMVFRIPVLHSADARETAELIRFAAVQIRRTLAGAIARPGYRPKGKRKRQLYILQGLPGVGPGRAAQLLERFGSVEGVFVAPHRDLAGVPGIGERTAHAIRQVVQEARSGYAEGADLSSGGPKGTETFISQLRQAFSGGL